MLTRRFAVDQKGNKIYVGSVVKYNNQSFLVEEIEDLSWNKDQYLTLADRKNKNKKIKFIDSKNVKVSYVL
tara:strand:- start:64602 stop:64814 length:213 start_codon:yes stop_codon:yes gene_type:complete